MRDRLPLLGFSLALLVAVLTVLFVQASARGDFAEPLSTYRSESDGARALYLVAQRVGLQPERRQLDFEHIEGTPELVLLGVEGDAPRTSEDAGMEELELSRSGASGWARARATSCSERWNRGRRCSTRSRASIRFLGELGRRLHPARWTRRLAAAGAAVADADHARSPRGADQALGLRRGARGAAAPGRPPLRQSRRSPSWSSGARGGCWCSRPRRWRRTASSLEDDNAEFMINALRELAPSRAVSSLSTSSTTASPATAR